MIAEAATGILFLHKIQFLSVNVRRKLLRCFVEAEDARELPMIFLSCDDKALDVISLLEDHVLAEIRLPSLTERSASRAAEAAGTFSGGGGMQNEAHDHAGVRGAHLPDAVPL